MGAPWYSRSTWRSVSVLQTQNKTSRLKENSRDKKLNIKIIRGSLTDTVPIDKVKNEDNQR